MLKLGLNVPPQQRESLTPSQLNWSTFKKVINKYIKLSIPLKTTDDINVAVNLLTASIQKASRESVKPYNHTNPLLHKSITSRETLNKKPMSNTQVPKRQGQT